MSIQTNLPGRVKNTPLAYDRGLMPLFEAVQNSIHAIEEVGSGDGLIVVEIIRSTQATLGYREDSQRHGPEPLAEISGFKVTDNGIGFTDTHMRSFETLDTELKAAIGGRGVGRLLWLKAFDAASIDSTYVTDDGRKLRRTFTFATRQGVSDSQARPADETCRRGSRVYLQGFNPRYRDASRKTGEAIATSLLEHCLWYFVREGGAPTILVKDGEETINLNDVYERHMHSSATMETVSIKGFEFELTHIKLRAVPSKSHFIGWCAANRLVEEESISGRIPGLYGKLEDGGDSFIYACYVTSGYLDARVRPERTGFVLEKTSSHGLFTDTEIAESELRMEILGHAEHYLSEYLAKSRQAGLLRVKEFVNKRQPRYRPLLSRMEESDLYVDPRISDRDLDLHLHKHRYEAESRLLSEGHEIMTPKSEESLEEYEERVRDYLELADEIKRSDLAEYVSHRKVILDLLKMAIVRNEDGKYAREDLIHDLIMPMRTGSDSIEFERNNLWLIDERLTFHDFLASDTPLKAMPITDREDKRRPDVLALNVYDHSVLLAEGRRLPLASIVIVEIKRPMRNDAAPGEDRDPIEQTLGYLRRIRAGKMQTASGRLIPDAPHVPGFCYVVCDMTPTIKERCEVQGLHPTSDHMGYFGYNAPLKAYIEIISFDRLVNGATERNRAFFDRLGLPAN